jgi:ribosomal protein S18 acetylase RimI-like enzyme
MYRPTATDIDAAFRLRPMTPQDYDQVISLLSGTPAIVLREADALEAVARFLARNPGCSFVVLGAGSIVGCVFGGHDGRRGYLHHLAVMPAHRRRGLGRRLVSASLDALANEGIHKAHIDILDGNAPAQDFWEAIGWTRRSDLMRYSTTVGGAGNA